ncbi:hypothetical protein FIU94_14765 [Sulfitobacter sp. THAF37]|uniref:DUF2254 domain-containing protein n=1 Tax=Sulfitobacter sp. THAF37 TaxID=2587855 RepID=UPI0012697E75|nr:DUF2254 domain-containing protein [Sulfitobacter sp. THAF37]QFT60090.1 hypothetical protein FIU94_14765 [Sulfitobacter sp. THAF37]
MNIDFLIPSTLIRKSREYTRKLWVRVVLMGFMAILSLGLTQLIEGFVPDEIATSLTGSAADRLLSIIANAMLAVTTFSLTVMVSVYRASSTQWTPRIHRLIIQDRTTQNTLAVFIGAYVYALIAIIMRELGIYVDERAFVLFIMTVIVLAVIVIYLIRWTLHLQSFGSLIDTTRQIEEVTRRQFTDRLENPCLGARALTDGVPDDAEVIRAEQSGYVQLIYPEALNRVAENHGVELYLTRNVGSFVFINEPLLSFVRVGDPVDDEHTDETLEKGIRESINIGDLRTYDQDPRFGLIVMGEVASKALSPGVNDPGTAIDVISRIGRVLTNYKDEIAQDRDEKLDNIYVAPLDPADLIQDAFGALARDGSSVVEVQQTLQATLAGLMQHPDDGLRDAAAKAAEIHLERALGEISFGPDRERLMNSAARRVRDAVSEKLASGGPPHDGLEMKS